MMAEQKGQRGKKPKYQIADIGGADLTSQDISTERVLNFLIKGEIGSTDQSSPASLGEADAAATVSAASEASPRTSNAVPDASLPSSEVRGGKSLAHLFERASSSSGTAKASNSTPAKQEQPKSASRMSIEHEESAQKEPPTVLSQIVHKVEAPVPSSALANAVQDAQPENQPRNTLIQQSIQVESTALEVTLIPSSAAVDISSQTSDLPGLTALWKTFYRLNAGEVEVLHSMYLMTHAQGSSECYIKMQKLAEMSRLTYRYCQKVARNLEQLGWITKLKDYDPTNQLGVLYRLNLTPSNPSQST